MKPLNLNTQTILFGICVLVGALLRFWNPSELAFINDELSTWDKLNYDSIGGLINNIKVDDSHPVGMYVFLYYWTALFGKSQLAIKLPFAFMALGSMGLVYAIAKKWFNQTVAILVLAYFATLQYPIWWAAIARQYQSGLFCGLLMVWCWTQLLVAKKDDKKYWIGFVLAGAGAMYNHYFSLIFAAMVGVSGLVWIDKKRILKYVGAGVAMVLLFLPHIGITIHQLTHADGHTWYNAPDSSFLTNHIHYIFHYSWVCLGLILFLLCFSLMANKENGLKSNWKIRGTALFFFLFPLLFGYFYSVYKSPILRESHLLFSFPFLLITLLSFFPQKINKMLLSALVGIVLVVNIYTLVNTRQHYQTMNSHPYKPFVKQTKLFLEEHKTEEVTIVLGENPVYLEYYKTALAAPFKHIESFRPAYSFVEFEKLVKNSPKPYLIVGSLPEQYIQLALEYYPYILTQKQGINYEYYILTKKKEEGTKVKYAFESTFGFNDEKERAGWKSQKDWVTIDTQAVNFYCQMPEGTEWGTTFEMPLDTLVTQKNMFLDAALDVRTDSLLPTGYLVIEIKDKEGKQLAWLGSQPIKQQFVKGKWQRIYLTMRLAHHLKDRNSIKNATFKAYYWNKEKQVVHLDRFSIKSRQGNSLLYKDTNPFEKY